jgi:Domain of Unknown Function (DUF928)
MKLLSQPTKLGLVLIITCSSLLGNLSWVQAKPILSNSDSPTPTVAPGNKTVRFRLPTLPPGYPPGGRVRGGARRGLCPATNPQFTALVPFTQPAPSVMHVWGLTTKERPTLWFYVPFEKKSAYPTEFILQDEEANPIYKSAIALPQQPGVMSVSLPASVPPLAIGKRYRWFFNVYCEPQQQAPPLYVEGVVQRVNLSPTVVHQLQTAQPRQKVAIYAENGIWHEAINTLAELRQKNPQDVSLQTQWKDLLEEIGLGDIAKVAIVPRTP